MLRIRALLKANPELTETRLGRDAVNDPNLIRDLRRGRALGAKMQTKLVAYLDGMARTIAEKELS